MMNMVEADLKQSPGAFNEYVTVLEENYINNVAQLRRMNNKQWVQTKIPIGIVIEILDKIEKPTIMAKPIVPGSIASIQKMKREEYANETMPTQMVLMKPCASDVQFLRLESSDRRITEVLLTAQSDVGIDPDSEDE